MKCLLLNSRSIVNKFDLFQATASVLNVDVIGVTETWLTSDISDSEIQLAGYEMFRKDRDNARGGGVLLYVKHFLTPSEFHTSTTFHDQVWCNIGDLSIGVCYRSNNTAIVGSDNNDHLLELFSEVGSKHILFMGDFNVPKY